MLGLGWVGFGWIVPLSKEHCSWLSAFCILAMGIGHCVARLGLLLCGCSPSSYVNVSYDLLAGSRFLGGNLSVRLV